MAKARKKPKQAKHKPAPSIIVDGVSYKIPAFLMDATNEEIARMIRGWKR